MVECILSLLPKVLEIVARLRSFRDFLPGERFRSSATLLLSCSQAPPESTAQSAGIPSQPEAQGRASRTGAYFLKDRGAVIHPGDVILKLDGGSDFEKADQAIQNLGQHRDQSGWPWGTMNINLHLVGAKYGCGEGWERPASRSSGFNSMFKGCLGPLDRGSVP